MNDKKIIYIDLETGGPDPRNTCLLQLSGAIEINWEIKEKFNVFLKPFPDDPDIMKEASDKHGMTKEIIELNEHNKYQDPAEVFTNFKAMLKKYVNPFDKTDKFIFVGYNCHAFDEPCLREFFKKNGDDYFGSWFWYPTLDVMHQYMADWWTVRDNMPNFQLMTVAKAAGIAVDESRLHDGLYDIELTRDLFVRHERTLQQMRDIYSKVQQQAIANQKLREQEQKDIQTGNTVDMDLEITDDQKGSIN